ncbi:MAG: hypothetical protein R2749_17045 [Acidimicrobiales bacterium]
MRRGGLDGVLDVGRRGAGQHDELVDGGPVGGVGVVVEQQPAGCGGIETGQRRQLLEVVEVVGAVGVDLVDQRPRLVVEGRLPPVVVALLERVAQLLELGGGLLHGGVVAGLGGEHQVVGHPVGLQQVGGRRQYVGHQLIGGADLVVGGAADADLAQGVERHDRQAELRRQRHDAQTYELSADRCHTRRRRSPPLGG